MMIALGLFFYMSIENKQNLPNFTETLKNRWRGLIKERLPVVEQDVVRVLALQIQAPEKIVCCLIPDANTLTSKNPSFKDRSSSSSLIFKSLASFRVC